MGLSAWTRIQVGQTSSPKGEREQQEMQTPLRGEIRGPGALSLSLGPGCSPDSHTVSPG